MTYASFWQWCQELNLLKSLRRTETEVNYECYYLQPAETQRFLDKAYNVLGWESRR